jgi:hypothetical protein
MSCGRLSSRCSRQSHRAGGLEVLEDEPRGGHPPTHSPEVRSTLVSLALQKPRSLGLPFELWTLERLQRGFKAREGLLASRSEKPRRAWQPKPRSALAAEGEKTEVLRRSTDSGGVTADYSAACSARALNRARSFRCTNCARPGASGAASATSCCGPTCPRRLSTVGGEIRCGRAAHRRNRATKRILEESVQLAGSRTEAIRCSRRAVSALVS